MVDCEADVPCLCYAAETNIGKPSESWGSLADTENQGQTVVGEAGSHRPGVGGHSFGKSLGVASIWTGPLAHLTVTVWTTLYFSDSNLHQHQHTHTHPLLHGHLDVLLSPNLLSFVLGGTDGTGANIQPASWEQMVGFSGCPDPATVLGAGLVHWSLMSADSLGWSMVG